MADQSRFEAWFDLLTGSHWHDDYHDNGRLPESEMHHVLEFLRLLLLIRDSRTDKGWQALV
jgi:hypothetical protein